MNISQLAERLVKIVDDEGYYDKEAAGSDVDRYILTPIWQCLEGLRMRRLSDGSSCWCLVGPSEIRTAAGFPLHTEACETARTIGVRLVSGEVELSEWLPIATVPKDGSEILLAHANSQWIDQWIADPKFEVRDNEGGCWMMCDQWEEPEIPTHWKPLSALPRAR